MKDKFTPDFRHKVAIFLNPRQKSMKVLPETDRAAVLEYVSDQLDQQPLRPRPVLPDSDDSAPATKRSRLTAIDEFDDDDQSQQDDMSEIQRYKTSAVNCIPRTKYVRGILWFSRRYAAASASADTSSFSR